MAKKANTLVVLFLGAVQISFQSPVNQVLHDVDVGIAAIDAPPPPSLHFPLSEQNKDHEIMPSTFSTIKSKRSSSGEASQQRAYPDSILYIKNNASDCNLEGSVGSTMKTSDHSATPTTLNSVLDCQHLCQRTTTCYSYSWEMTSGNGYDCTMYKTWIGHTPGAVDVGETGLFFSDKHVEDGTIWCYSSTPFMGSGLPGGPLIIT